MRAGAKRVLIKSAVRGYKMRGAHISSMVALVGSGFCNPRRVAAHRAIKKSACVRVENRQSVEMRIDHVFFVLNCGALEYCVTPKYVSLHLESGKYWYAFVFFSRLLL